MRKMNSIDFSELIRKLKEDKKLMLVVCLGVIGMMLLCFSQFADEDSSAQNNLSQPVQYNQLEVQQSLEKIIECIDGAGKVKVMITYDTTTETVYAFDSDESQRNNETKQQNKHIIIDSDEGETGLMVKTVYPKVRGVAVVCGGADNPVIKEQIISVVSALFDISSRKITVAEMAE